MNSGIKTDRLERVQDPRGNSTWYDYDTSGRVTKVTHPDGSYAESHYNDDGTLDWTTDENHGGSPNKRTSYGYDQYKRVTSVTDPLGHTSTSSYAPWSSNPYVQTAEINSYSHTESFAFHTVSAAGKVVDRGWDVNHRLAWQRTATGTTEEATSSSQYDQRGNLVSTTDAKGNVTTYTYDYRNRKASMTPPWPFNLEVTNWEYDEATNKVTVVHEPEKNPGNRPYKETQYDSMSRVEKEWDEMRRLTQYEYWPSGMLKAVIDPKLQRTEFTYNERNQKISMKYPGTEPNTTGQTVQGWTYDPAGNMTARPTANPSQTQWFHYDQRNRLDHMRWNSGIDFADYQYDFANHVTSATNPYSTVGRHYDDAGRMDWESQSLATTPNIAANTLPVQSVTSYKDHGGYGHEIALPLSGSAGIECHNGGSTHNYLIVVHFSSYVWPPAFNTAQITSGSAHVDLAWIDGYYGWIYLSGVSNAQRLTIKLFGLADLQGNSGEFAIPMIVLVGDVNGDGKVDGQDQSLVSSQIGTPVNDNNFRSDVNADGVINASDLNLVANGSASFTPAAGPSPAAAATVHYAYDYDGRVQRLYVDGTDYDLSHSYDNTGRLEKIYETAHPQNLFQYAYDLNSNIGQRSTTWNEVNQLNQFTDVDQLNRISGRRIQARRSTLEGEGGLNGLGGFNSKGPEVNSGGGGPDDNLTTEPYDLSYEHYTHDQMSRLIATDREDDHKRDKFDYNDAGELVNATYGLPTPPPTPIGTPPPLSAPSFDPPDGSSYGPSHTATVIIATDTTGAHIRWTRDGTEPTESPNENGFLISGMSGAASATGEYSVTFKARAFKNGNASEVVTASYSWDPGYQANGASAGLRAVTYNLDDAGNRSLVTENDYVSSYGTNSLNQYTNAGFTFLTNGSEHEIASYENIDYQYIGDTHLAKVSSASQGIYELGYDAFGRTVRRVTNGDAVYYIYAGESAILEITGTQITSSMVYGIGMDEILLCNKLNATAQFFAQDGLGSVRAVTGSEGIVLEQYRYDAFGMPQFLDANRAPIPSGTSMHNNRFLFTGREWVQRFGFYEYRNRAYHPGLGRFMSEDPKGFDAGDHNLFRYCFNDPLDRTDPMGLWDDVEISAEFNNLGIQAAVNSRHSFVTHPGGGSGSRGQLIQENLSTHKLSLQNKIIQGEAIAIWGRRIGTNIGVQKGTLVLEEYKADRGYKERGIGHAHHDLAVEPKLRQQAADWTTKDIGQAQGSAKTDENGLPVWKALTSSKRIDRLTPQKNPGGKPHDVPLGESNVQPNQVPVHLNGQSAATIDAAHQAMGVPSLGAEAVNRLNGLL